MCPNNYSHFKIKNMSFPNERRILIETYRDWDIWYDKEAEEFIAEDGVNEDGKGRNSLSNARKFVDDFRKANAEFKPFKIINFEGWGTDKGTEATVVGMRKDARFVAERANGERFQLSDYDASKWALPNPENEPILKEIKAIEVEADAVRRKLSDANKRLKWVTLQYHMRQQDWADWTDRNTQKP